MHFSLNNWELLKKGCARLFLIKCQISGKEMPVLASRSASSLKSWVTRLFCRTFGQLYIYAFQNEERQYNTKMIIAGIHVL